VLRQFSFNNNNNLSIRDTCKITVINFKLNDTIFVGYSDGSIVKAKFNEEALNLKLKNTKIENIEDEFENIKSVFSSDNKTSVTVNESESYYENSVEIIMLSDRYKSLFAVHKLNAGLFKINVYSLRENIFEKTFCKYDGCINNATLLDKREIIIILTFNIDKKDTNIDIWSIHDGSVPIYTYNLSNLIDYSFTVKTLSIAFIPDKYYGRTSTHGIVDGDIIILGTTKGDIILGKIQTMSHNGKIGFDLLYIYKLKNTINTGNMLSNDFEISFIDYDLYFDVLLVGDVSSNMKSMEKILQLGYNENTSDSLPMFDPFWEAENPPINKMKYEVNRDLPMFSITHDILKDRNVILYDQGNELQITYEDDNE
jgi:hypothetical protein